MKTQYKASYFDGRSVALLTDPPEHWEGPWRDSKYAAMADARNYAPAKGSEIITRQVPDEAGSPGSL